MIRVTINHADYQVLRCNMIRRFSYTAQRDVLEGVSLKVRAVIKPKFIPPPSPGIRRVWINDYGDITEVKYNGRTYDFKKKHDAEMFL